MVPLAEVIADGLGQRVDLIAHYDIRQEEQPAAAELLDSSGLCNVFVLIFAAFLFGIV